MMMIALALAQQLAFPTAEGFGRIATGARGGTVYHVTHLGDSGPRSFRDAVSQPNRTVVFDVGGVIRIGGRYTNLEEYLQALVGEGDGPSGPVRASAVNRETVSAPSRSDAARHRR